MYFELRCTPLTPISVALCVIIISIPVAIIKELHNADYYYLEFPYFIAITPQRWNVDYRLIRCTRSRYLGIKMNLILSVIQNNILPPGNKIMNIIKSEFTYFMFSCI